MKKVWGVLLIVVFVGGVAGLIWNGRRAQEQSNREFQQQQDELDAAIQKTKRFTEQP